MLHILEDRSFKLSPLAIPIAHVVIMFNAAVNPFAYALINERFRQKMKEMMCSGSRSLATKHFVTSARALHKKNESKRTRGDRDAGRADE